MQIMRRGHKHWSVSEIFTVRINYQKKYIYMIFNIFLLAVQLLDLMLYQQHTCRFALHIYLNLSDNHDLFSMETET
jgi:hypothetical protein